MNQKKNDTNDFNLNVISHKKKKTILKEKGLNFNKKKGLAICTTAMMMSLMFNPIAANAVTLHHKKKDEVVQETNLNQETDINTQYMTNNVSNYAPGTLPVSQSPVNVETQFFTSGHIANQTFSNNIRFSFHSKDGKVYNINDVKINAIDSIVIEKKAYEDFIKKDSNIQPTITDAQNNSMISEGYEAPINTTSSGVGVITQSLQTAPINLSGIQNTVYIQFTINGKTYSKLVSNSVLKMPNSKNYINLGVSPETSVTPYKTASLKFITNSNGIQNLGNFDYYDLNTVKYIKVKLNYNTKNYLVTAADPLIKSLGNNEYDIPAVYFSKSNPVTLNFNIKTLIDKNSEAKVNLEILGIDTQMPNLNDTNVIKISNATSIVNFKISHGNFNIQQTIKPEFYSNTDGKSYNLLSYKGTSIINIYNNLLKLNADIYSAEYLRDQYAILNINGVNLSNPDYMYYSYKGNLSIQAVLDKIANNISVNGLIKVTPKNMNTINANLVVSKKTVTNFNANFINEMNVPVANNLKTQNPFIKPSANMYTVVKVNNPSAANLLNSSWKEFSLKTDYKKYDKNNLTMIFGHYNANQTFNSSGVVNFPNSNVKNISSESYMDQKNLRGVSDSIDYTSPLPDTLGIGSNMTINLDYSQYLSQQGNNPANNGGLTVTGLLGEGVINNITDGASVTDVLPVDNYLYFNTQNITLNTDGSSVSIAYINNQNTISNITIPLSKFKFTNGKYSISNSELGVSSKGMLQATLLPSFKNELPPLNFNINGIITTTKVSDSELQKLINESWNDLGEGSMQNINGNVIQNGLLSSIQDSIQSVNYQVSGSKNDDCYQNIITFNKKTGNGIIKNTVTNNSELPTEICSIEGLPTTNGLASNYNLYSSKNLKSKLDSISNISKGSIYLLPTKYLNQYRDLLYSKTTPQKGEIQKIIDTIAVPYKKGMDLNNYCGVIYNTGILKPKESASYDLGLTIDGVKPNEQQVLYTAFKYFDKTFNEGSISNINKIDLYKNVVDTAIVTTQVQTESGEILVNPVTTIGIQNTKIGYKIPNIPKGYHLVNITENGNSYTPNKNGDVVGQATPTHLVWIVAKNTHKYQVKFTSNIQGVSYGLTTNEWSGSYNAPNDNGLTTNVIPLNGATETWEGATAPTGYQQIGQPKITTVTTGEYDKVTTITYTYNFAPIPKVTVSNIVELPDGTILPNLGDSVSGYPNGNVELAEPNIPEGYHLVKEPTNMPLLFPNSNVKCIWVIAKNQIVVNAKYIDATTGKEITGGNFNINGKIENTAILAPTPNVSITPNKIPSGYRVVGKEIFTNSENADKDQVINAVQKLEKIENKVEYKAIDQNGTIVNGVSATINDNSNILNKSLTNKDGLESIADSNVTRAVTNTSSIPVGYKETGKLSITPIKDSNGNITYEIIQHLIKLASASVTTEIINSTGKVLVPKTSYTGYEGDTITYKVPKIPKDYKVIEITDNDKSYTPNTNILHPNTGSVVGTIATQNIVWKVEKENTNVTVKYMDNGKEIGEPSTSNIKTGTPLSSVKLICPTGYKIINVDVNGSIMKNGVVTENALPTPNIIIVNLNKLHETINVAAIYNGKDIAGTTITTNNGNLVTGSNVVSKQVNYDSYKNSSVSNIPNGYKQAGKMIVTKTIDPEGNQIINITVPLEKIPQGTVTTIVKDSSNNIIVPLQSTTGYTGTNDTAKAPVIPKGYKIVSITNNGKTVNGLPKTFTNKTQNIVWHVIKEESVTTKIIAENGKILTPSKTTTVNYDSSINGLIPSISKGYKIVKVVYNNNDYKNVSEIPSKITQNTNITIIVKKIEKGTITTKVVSKDGQDLVPEKSYTGIVGTNDTAIAPTIPSGWKLVGITNNGKSVQGLPTSYTKETQNIIWIVEKIQKQEPAKVIVKIVDKATGQEIGTPITTSAIVGTDINSNYMPTIPTGYTNEGVITDGVNTGMTPQGKVAPGTNNIIVYVNKKVVVNKPVKETVNAKVVEEGTGKVLNSNPTVTVNKGTPLNGSFLPTVPKGYKIDSITVNGVKEDNGISGVINAPTNIVVTVSPIAKGSITVIVKDTTGNIVVKEMEATGLDNSIDTLKEPIIPNGYKIIKITNNGVNCSGMPKDFTGSTQNIVYTVQKEVTTVTTSVVTDNGVTLQAPSTVNAKIGVALDGYIPLVQKGYKVTKIEVNGTDYTNALGVNGNTLSSPNNIIVYVTKDAPIVPKTPSKPSIQNKGKINVTVETNEGKILVPTASYEGLAGADDTASIPTVPAGWKIDKITNNGEVITGLPKKFNDSTQNIVYTVSKVQKDVKITTTVETENGKILVNPATVTGKTGNATGLELTIPNGYHLVKITSNDKNINELPSKFGNENQNIMIIVEKDVVPTKPNNTPTKKETPSPKIKEVHTTPLNQVKQTKGISQVNVNTPNTSVSPVSNTNNIKETPVSSNPKTGDTSNLPFAFGILGAIAGLFAVNKRKKKDTSLNKNS